MTWAWCTENQPQRLVPAETWLAGFGALDFTCDPETPIARPVSPARLWRGAAFEHRAGLAWTSDRGVAQTFAEQHAAEGSIVEVFTACVEALRVKARYNKDEEQEWVIDTRDLDIVKDQEIERSSG